MPKRTSQKTLEKRLREVERGDSSDFLEPTRKRVNELIEYQRRNPDKRVCKNKHLYIYI